MLLESILIFPLKGPLSKNDFCNTFYPTKAAAIIDSADHSSKRVSEQKKEEKVTFETHFLFDKSYLDKSKPGSFFFQAIKFLFFGGPEGREGGEEVGPTGQGRDGLTHHADQKAHD